MGMLALEGVRKRGPRRKRRGRERSKKKKTRNGLEHVKAVAMKEEAAGGGGRWMLWWISGGGMKEDFLEVVCVGVEGDERGGYCLNKCSGVKG
ncbi:hypothetical protein D8674_025131 [Pyrus ussuriensis x Pyrus communis]|uniref:Uncharacterized protein n=1 Tax=Pyrus ussuriensis x Pyrus communis TaxID=2448454 RepID=A0A5N5H4T3_9ROSA|nr:hypothetical protein D8674_025131 [Pyrus ussuriensis x Pyrus communis]